MRKDGNYSEKIEDLAGLSKKRPMMALAFLIIFFSLAGIPPLGGFFAKFYVFMAVIESEMYFLAVVGLLSTVIAAFYYIKVIKVIYFDDSKIVFDDFRNVKINFTIFITCIFLLTFFIYPSILNNIVNSLFF